MNRKILVTGGAGYIGSHTVVALIEEGYEVIVVDDLSNSKKDTIARIEKIVNKRIAFEKIDLKDYKLTKQLFEKYDFASIIHFAASKAVGESVKLPLKYYRNNIQSTLNLLELMVEFNIHNMVFSSSCTVYGQPDTLPVTEQSPLKQAESPYGNTKKITEDILKDSAFSNPKLQFVALRYFNPIGAHPTAMIGELPLGVPDNLVPFIMQAASKKLQINVYGNDYNTPDGTAIRDYIHVIDLAKAHIAALKRIEKDANRNNYEYFNIGTGVGYSVLEIINTFERVNNIKLNYKMVPRRAGDIEQIYADTTLSFSELGWKSELGLEEMLKSAWAWQKQLIK